MSPLLRRLRAAVAPRYRVRSELGGGGTARVFLAHDPALDRPVAIKVLRPERATARPAEEFLREARTVARLSHPNVVPIHEVGREGGLFYYVMAHVEGPTLRARLEEGPLPGDEAVRVAIDLLRALEAAHSAGVIHQDVKPGNVFLLEDRALLGDFGVAREQGGDGERRPSADPACGTPGYMAPEQAAGRAVDRRADLYAVGLVLHEALSGRRWPPFLDPDRADWSDIPADVAPALRRALRIPVEERWSDARAFRQALVSAGGTRRGGRKVVGLGAFALAVLLAGAWGVFRFALGGDGSRPLPYDLAVLPCEAIDPDDSTLASQTSLVAANALENLPGLHVVSHRRSFRWWSHRGAGAAEPYRSAIGVLESAVVTKCTLQPAGGDSVAVDLELVGRSGDAPPPVQLRAAAGDAPVALGNDLALAVVRRLRPGVVLSRPSFAALSGRPGPAVRNFLRGEAAFQRDARCRAQAYYEAAIEIDPSFALARWRSLDLQRYVSAEPPETELQWLQAHAVELGPVDRSMLAARSRPPGPDRIAAYRRAIQAHPRDDYLLFTYGDELFHRGPLWGIPPDSGRDVLRLVAARDSFLAPAYDHLLMALIRAGERDEARRTLEHLRALKEGSGDRGCELYDPSVLGLAFLERFEPGRARKARSAVVGEPGEGDPEVLGPASRLVGPYLDLSATQSALGRRLRSTRHATRRDRVNGRVAEGLGLWARGRVAEALAQFDTAALLDGGSEGRLHAAEWRVVPRALGLPGVPDAELEAGRATLRSLARGASSSEVALRARFALGLLEAGLEDGRSGSGTSAPEVGEIGGPGVAAEGAAGLLAAQRRARSGSPVAAFALIEPLLAYPDRAAEPGPFFRSAVYLLRGTWQRDLDRPEEAAASWLWHEAVDLSGEPSAFAQRGEVGWVLGAWADARRAAIAAETGDESGACGLAREALRHWGSPDATLVPLRRETADLRDRVCAP